MAREEHLRRPLDAERALAADGPVRHVVHVLPQHPLLAVDLLELGGELRLADLPLDVALRVLYVQRAHELLRDRRAALDGVAREDVLHRGAGDARDVHGAVAVEAPVLDRDRGLAGDERHLPPRDGEPDGVGLHVAEARPIGGVDHGAGALVDRLQRLDVGRGGRDLQHPADDREDRDATGREQQGERQPDPLLDPGVAASPP